MVSTFKIRRFVTFRQIYYQAFRNYYRPQRSWGKFMFLHVSVILFTGAGGGGIPACIAGGIQACLAGLQRGSPGPHLGGSSGPHPGGSPGPYLGGHLQAHTWGVSRPTPRGVYPSMHWGRPPHPPLDGYCCGRYTSYSNAFLFNTKITESQDGE